MKELERMEDAYMKEVKRENELKYYSEIGNWDFSKIKCKTEIITNWDFYEKIKENINEKSLCLDIGTGGGEKVLKNYPEVAMVIATDFSEEMIKTAKANSKKYQNRNIRFCEMDNENMKFPKETFDLVSARHTVIDAKQIYEVLIDEGVLIIEGIDKDDCIEIKEIFGRGQGYKDKKAISEIDYEALKDAGFKDIEKVEILQNEYYGTEEDLLALLLKTPILDDFSEENNAQFEHKKWIEPDKFREYVEKYKTEKGILLKRRLYGIVGRKKL